MAAIAVHQLTKRFGRKTAVDRVSFSVDEGEMVALIGASGSGKSTLMRHIAGLERSDPGASRVDLFGCCMQSHGKVRRGARHLRRNVGVVFQQFNLVSRLPVMTNVLTGVLGGIPAWRGTLGLFNGAEKARAQAALTRVGVGHTARQRASTLSVGQQQRAAIARTLVQGARVILADEPVASLDPASARLVMETLAAINTDDGITVLVSLHQVEFARQYCPRTIALRDGAVVFDGPSTALTDSFLAELYGDASRDLLAPLAPAETHAAPARPGAGAYAGIA